MLKFRPIQANEIDVRIQSINKKYVILLLYKDARVDQNILDETVGALNWQKSYSRDNQNCTVTIWDDEKKMWIAKEDTGTESNTEKEKGLASDSFKRACFCWGIGRELYTSPIVNIPIEFIEVKEYNGRQTTYDKFYVDSITVAEDEQTGIKTITQLSIGIEHYDKKAVVWKWTDGLNVVTTKPKWNSKTTEQEANVPKCSQCGNTIKGTAKASAEKIAEWNYEQFGRVLCAKCGKAEADKRKAAQ